MYCLTVFLVFESYADTKIGITVIYLTALTSFPNRLRRGFDFFFASFFETILSLPTCCAAVCCTEEKEGSGLGSSAEGWN